MSAGSDLPARVERARGALEALARPAGVSRDSARELLAGFDREYPRLRERLGGAPLRALVAVDETLRRLEAAGDESLWSAQALARRPEWARLRGLARAAADALPRLRPLALGPDSSWRFRFYDEKDPRLGLLCESSDPALNAIGGVMARGWGAARGAELVGLLEERSGMGYDELCGFGYEPESGAVEVVYGSREAWLFAQPDFDVLAAESCLLMLRRQEASGLAPAEPSALTARLEAVRARGRAAGGPATGPAAV